MMFSLIIFYWSAIDGHCKSEVLEIFNMKEECYHSIFFLKAATIWSIIYVF